MSLGLVKYSINQGKLEGEVALRKNRVNYDKERIRKSILGQCFNNFH